MPPELSDSLTEPDRRALVRNIAARGRRGYEIKKETVQPSVDYAAAAEAAMRADPVELPPAAQAELSDRAQAASTDAERFAEAQRAIFNRSAQRELDYNNKYYDQASTTIDATNFQLNKFAEEIARRAAARRGGGGGGFSLPAEPTPEDTSSSLYIPGGGSQPEPAGPLDNLTETQFKELEKAVNYLAEQGIDSSAAIDALDNEFASYLAQGVPFAQARARIWSDLVQRGVPGPVANALLAPLVGVWQPEFLNKDVSYEGTPGPGVSGPYIPGAPGTVGVPLRPGAPNQRVR